MKIQIAEKDLEQFLLQNREHHTLWSKDTLVLNQVRLGDAGIADIITIDCSLDKNQCYVEWFIKIYELKVNSLTVSDFTQLQRYCSYLQEYLNHYPIIPKSTENIRFFSCLIGPGPNVSWDLFCISNSNVCSDFDLITYELDPKIGISFSHFYSDHFSETPPEETIIFLRKSIKNHFKKTLEEPFLLETSKEIQEMAEESHVENQIS